MSNGDDRRSRERPAKARHPDFPISRRGFVGLSSIATIAAVSGIDLRAWAARAEEPLRLPQGLPSGVRESARLETLPGKKPLIKLTFRPPNYETPLGYFQGPITANDAFYVRYHNADIPEIDAANWKLGIGGDGATGTAEFSLDELRSLPATEVTAINQCSGNRRGLFEPHVPGVQWGYGAMGCARWKGVPLRTLLDRAGLKKEAIEIAFNGADLPAMEKTPDFVKSLPVWKAIEDTTLVAYEMNGEPLPHFNGFPARLVVPGWTGTYWVKHLTNIQALTEPESGFWMAKAYRIPVGKFPMVARFTSQETAMNTPITEIMVNSVITSPADGQPVKAGTPVRGLAWDGGYGISLVEVSTDGGNVWHAATLGEDLGRYAFRTWSFDKMPKHATEAMVRATNAIGQTQTAKLIQNPAGYHHNLMHRIHLRVV